MVQRSCYVAKTPRAVGLAAGGKTTSWRALSRSNGTRRQSLLGKSLLQKRAVTTIIIIMAALQSMIMGCLAVSIGPVVDGGGDLTGTTVTDVASWRMEGASAGGEGKQRRQQRRQRLQSASSFLRRRVSSTEEFGSGNKEEDSAQDCNLECCSQRYLEGLSPAPIIRAGASDHGDSSSRSLQDGTSSTTACPSEEEDSSWVNALPTAIQYIFIIILVCFSALFSGLTLGLMSLDTIGLEIVMEGDDPAAAASARKIYPLRKNGNLLLCTLLLGNVAVNALLSILMADISGGLLGFLVSTAVIVIFGEIVPQAACSRYALQIGSRAIPIVKVIMCLLYPLAFPLAFALDKALGHEIGTTYSKSEMLKLLEIHVTEGRFDQQTGTAMTGALMYQDMTVKEVMTPIEHTFMLSVEDKLNFETVATIFKTGYSRIPVYEVSVNNIIGLLFVKDLIFIDPEDETPVRNFVQIFGRGVHVVWPDDKLGDVLRELKQGRSHMALVRDVNNDDKDQDPFYEIKGIITLEDIIEIILGDEIVDETDAFVDQTHSIKVNRMENFDWGRLRLLDAKIVDAVLSPDEVKAVTAHLRTNFPDAVALLSDKHLYKFVAETSVTELPAAEQEIGQDLPADLMYETGVPTGVCTLILGGKVTVLAGADNFRSDVSSWAVLASSALIDPNYKPDFTAYVSSGPCRCLRFSRDRFTAAVDACTVEKVATKHGEHIHHHPPRDSSSSLPPNESVANISTSSSSTVGAGINGTDSVRENENIAPQHTHARNLSVSWAPEKTDAVGGGVKNRAEIKKQRSQLLAAFVRHVKGKETDGDKQDNENENAKENNDKKETDAEPQPASDVNGKESESTRTVAESDSSSRQNSAGMSPLQRLLTHEGSYAPRPRSASSKGTTRGADSERPPTSEGLSSIEFIDIVRRSSKTGEKDDKK